MDDLISRQAVIEINRSYHGQMPNEVNHRIWKEINELPSAQPETHEERTERTCDCIERKAAIDALHWYFDGMLETDTWSPCDVYGLIEILPPAQPEIVRCKDCKHWSRESICDGFCAEDCMRHDEDFYCGYAERRTDE